MKRLLKISLDLALITLFPILGYFALSITVDKNLINIFTICYPLYFFYYALRAVFGTGANISKERDNNSNAVLSGVIVGSIVAIIIYGISIFFIDEYLLFMNVDPNIYKNFVIYSLLQTIIQVVFTIVIEKLYYEEKNTQANIYSIIFNVLNFLTLVITSLITKNQFIIIAITLISILLYTIFVVIKVCDFKSFKYKLDIKKCIKYNSIEVVDNLFFFLIFLFSISNTNSFGPEYTTALTFVTLITDTQWDLFSSIITVAKIDITKNRFNYKEHIKNAYKLLVILLISVFIMFIIFYRFYELNLVLVAIYFSFELINFSIHPVYKIKTCYLQLEYSALKTTINKIIASILRVFVSLLKTPFCTGLGQASSSVYQLVSLNYIFDKHYYIDKEGFIHRKVSDFSTKKVKDR